MKWRDPERSPGRVAPRLRCVWLVWLILLFALGVPLSCAQDFQSWSELDLTASYKGVDFLVPLLARNDSRLPNPQLAAIGVTADFRLPRHLTLTGGYLFAVAPQRSLDVHLPLVAITPTFRFRRVVLADRNRFEKLIGFGNCPVRYRNRLLLDFPFGVKESWHGFASDEVLFNLSDRTWNQNRLQVGGGRQLTTHVLLDLYYLRRNLSGGAPAQNVLGTTVKISLRSRKEITHGPDHT